MLLKDREIAIENEQTAVCYSEGNLVIYNLGCFVSRADATKLFYLLKDRIKEPTLIIFCCNVTEASTFNARKKILELKEKYFNYKVFITGCINEIIKDRFKNLGIIVYKEDMWELEKYE